MLGVSAARSRRWNAASALPTPAYTAAIDIRGGDLYDSIVRASSIACSV